MKGKRLGAIALIGVILINTLLLSSGCTKKCKEHTWRRETTATCTEIGIETRMCIVCEEIEREEVGPYGHRYGRVRNMDITDRYAYKYACTRCGKDLFKVEFDDTVEANYNEQGKDFNISILQKSLVQEYDDKLTILFYFTCEETLDNRFMGIRFKVKDSSGNYIEADSEANGEEKYLYYTDKSSIGLLRNNTYSLEGYIDIESYVDSLTEGIFLVEIVPHL